MVDDAFALVCERCSNEEDRRGSLYCRKCGAALATGEASDASGDSATSPDGVAAPEAPLSGGPMSGVAKTEPDLEPMAALSRRSAPTPPSSAIDAVRAVLIEPVGPPWYAAFPLAIVRAVLVFVVVTAAAAALGFLRQIIGGDVPKAAASSQGTILDISFGTLLLAVTALLTRGVLALTGRGWRRPAWGRP